MKINDPFQMNDWPIKKFLIIIFTFQLLLWGFISLDLIGFEIPILRQLICFVYLTFVPGTLILRVLRLHNLGSTESLLYCIGLSLSFLMFIGFFMSTFYPLIGINKPISLTPLVITVSVVVLISCIFSYIVDKDLFDINPSIYIDCSDLFCKKALLLYFIPFISIFGAYLVNYYMDNKFIFIFLILIPFLICLVEFDILQEKYYPVLIFSISISLLYHTSLISKYIVEWADTSFEYWYSSRVLANSLWNQDYFSNVNGMLSIVMIAPIYSILCKLSLTWVYKLIYPFFFSFVPLGLYVIYNKQLNNTKMSFYSVFFFISMFTFYTTMIGLARQQIAELFFVLLISLFINNISQPVKSVLSIIFVFSIIVSHYAFSYIFLGSLVCSWIYLYIILNINIRNDKISFSIPHILQQIKSKNNPISATFVLLTAVFTFYWYIFIANSAFNSIIYIVNNILSNIIVDFLSPENTQGLDILLATPKTGLIGFIYKLTHISTQIFIVVGLSYSLFTKGNKIQKEFLAISIPFLLLCILGVLIPHFASSINTDRLYGISLLILAPYCIIGGNLIVSLFLKLFKSNSSSYKSTLRFFSIFLGVYFLFNSGLIYELCGYHSSYSLNQTAVNRTSFNLYDVSGATWLCENLKSDKIIYADVQSAYLTQMKYGEFQPLKRDAFIPLTNDSYIFLGSKCFKDNILELDDPIKSRLNVTSVKYSDSKYFNKILMNNNIYTNGYTKVYCKSHILNTIP